MQIVKLAFHSDVLVIFSPQNFNNVKISKKLLLSSLPSCCIGLASYMCTDTTVGLPSAGMQPPAEQQEQKQKQRQC